MYNASTAFRNAVYKNSPLEQVIIKFRDGTILTNEDIHVNNGLKVMESFNLEEELTIGTCLASSLDVTIMNGHRLLSDFGFGEAEVMLGVCTEQTKATPGSELCRVVVGSNVYTGHASTPYLRLNGSAAASQPNFPVCALVVDNGTVYSISETGNVYPNSAVPNSFMKAKLTEWAFEGLGLYFVGNTLYECHADGTTEKYEFVPLGVFDIKTPVKRKIDMIAINAEDKMARFDVIADKFLDGLTYPITLGEIYSQLCAFVGISTVTTSFINSTRVFEASPVLTQNITARDILSWIAEAACSIARMTRDGKVELAWFTDTNISIPMNQYFSIEAAEYDVPPIDKLQVSGSETDIGVIIGTGTNGYQIVDNPYLSGLTDEEIRTYGQPIYNRLSAFKAFEPVLAHAVCDWSIQAGDIITLLLDGVSYKFPIYCQTITWNGSARVDYESSGSDGRPVMSAENRKDYQTKRAMHELVVDINGIKSNMTLMADDITTLNTRIEIIPGEILAEIDSKYATSEEVSNASASTLSSAKSYADSAVASLSSTISSTYQTKSAASSANASTLASAKSYTDSSISTLKSSISSTYQTKSATTTAINNAISTAESYTDKAISTLKTEISSTYQTKSATTTAINNAISTAESYTDKAIANFESELSAEFATEESVTSAMNSAISTSEAYADKAISTFSQEISASYVKGDNNLYSSSAIIQKASADAQKAIASLELSVSNGETSSTIKLMNGTTEISSQDIKINGMVTFEDLSSSGATTISGDNVTTGQLKSANYKYSSGNFSTAGTMIDLSNGLIRSKSFAIDSSGSAYMKGSTFTDGTITGSTIYTGTGTYRIKLAGNSLESQMYKSGSYIKHGFEISVSSGNDSKLTYYNQGTERGSIEFNEVGSMIIQSPNLYLRGGNIHIPNGNHLIRENSFDTPVYCLNMSEGSGSALGFKFDSNVGRVAVYSIDTLMNTTTFLNYLGWG